MHCTLHREEWRVVRLHVPIQPVRLKFCTNPPTTTNKFFIWQIETAACANILGAHLVGFVLLLRIPWQTNRETHSLTRIHHVRIAQPIKITHNFCIFLFINFFFLFFFFLFFARWVCRTPVCERLCCASNKHCETAVWCARHMLQKKSQRSTSRNKIASFTASKY